MSTQEEIQQINQKPLIAVIGATMPNDPYVSSMGIYLGYALRESLDKHEGTVFTGGVDGVGADVYGGVVRFCFERGMKTSEVPDDKFFVLAPHGIVYGELGMERIFHYPIPRSYTLLASLVKENGLTEYRAGQEMGERRKILAEIADVGIMLNGSGGTTDEALQILNHGKRIIVCPYSGGATRALMDLKNDNLTRVQRRTRVKRQVLERIDPELIVVADNADEAITALYDVSVV